jgi:hypothetical protein
MEQAAKFGKPLQRCLTLLAVSEILALLSDRIRSLCSYPWIDRVSD